MHETATLDTQETASAARGMWVELSEDQKDARRQFRACVDACLAYTAERRQFNMPLNDHQLVRRKLTEMIVDTRAARLLCYRAGTLRDLGDPGPPWRR